MKLSSRKLNREKRVELQMTSMIDVVFLLLIFFIVTAAFVKTERALDPAIKAKQESAQPSDFEPTVVEIVEASGSFAFQLGNNEFTSRQELTDTLKRLPNKAEGAFVKGNGNAPWQMAAEAMQACRDARFGNVTYVPQGSN